MASLHQRRSFLPEDRLEVHAEVEAHVGQLLLHLAQGRLSEVADLEELRLGARDELADRTERSSSLIDMESFWRSSSFSDSFLRCSSSFFSLIWSSRPSSKYWTK